MITPTPRPYKRSKTEVPTPANASTSKENVYGTPTHTPFPELQDDDNYDNGNDFVKEDVQTFGSENVDTIANPYIVPSFYNRPLLVTKYGIRKICDSFMIGYSAVLIDTDSDITIKGQEFRSTKGLWVLWTRKNVN